MTEAGKVDIQAWRSLDVQYVYTVFLGQARGIGPTKDLDLQAPLHVMTPPSFVRSLRLRSTASICRRYLTTATATATATTPTAAQPLRILFAGTDHFSATSLKALYLEQKSNRELIRSIDVLCRKDAMTGRNLKTLREGSPFI
jgi:hypothetical protein